MSHEQSADPFINKYIEDIYLVTAKTRGTHSFYVGSEA